jgi:uridine phosphorylase
MGWPPTAIGVEELIRIGAKNIIRIGTCGVIQPYIQTGESSLSPGGARGT